MLVNANGIYYVHVCEQAGNSVIEHLCTIIIKYTFPRDSPRPLPYYSSQKLTLGFSLLSKFHLYDWRVAQLKRYLTSLK